MKVKRIINYILILIVFVSLISLILFIKKLGVIPIKYTLILSIFLFILLILSSLFILLFKKKYFKIIGYVLLVIILLINCISSYYVYKTDRFLDNAFGDNKVISSTNYYVLVKKDNNYKNISNLKDKSIGYYTNSPNMDLALNKLKEIISYKEEAINDLSESFKGLNNNSITGLVIEENLYRYIFDNNLVLNMNIYDILYKYSVETKEEIILDDNEISNNISNSSGSIKNNNKKKNNNSYNIYIGGTDFTGVFTDFNMVVTLNKDTNKVLFTSTPRDFYVDIYGKGGKDLLGYAGVWGINTQVKTISNLYGIDIPYYIKVKASSLVRVVDTLGGITFCSDRSFLTNHALVLDTYDDSKGKKLYVEKGCKNYNGIEILTISRERRAYPDGDRQRQKNCEKILEAILNKIASPKLLVNYPKFLDSLENTYTTNIPRDFINDITNDILDNGNRWKYLSQSVSGYDSRGNVHFSNYQDYVMRPNYNTVNNAKNKIKQILNGK